MTWRTNVVSTLFFLGTAGLGGLPPNAAGQGWEADLRWMTIDHDPPSNVASSGEQIPSGLGLSVRHVWPSSPFLGVRMSRGSEDRRGAICGGFVFDPGRQCTSETVSYSGGLVALSAGWRFALDVGSGWWLGIRPTAGLGTVWIRETGKDTGRSYSEAPLTFLAGLELEGARRLPLHALTIIASLGVNHLRPTGLDVCEDCRQVLREPMPQVEVGLGLAW